MPSLSSIIAQDAPVATLRAAAAADRLPHALLFAGPEGVGKGTTAEALGKLFLCEKPTKADSCGTCASCVLFEAGTHPDFHRVYRQLIRLSKDSVARDLSVDVIRDFLVMPAGRSSQLGRGKVFVVEEADSMNPTAQNALLKTLEEPPGRALIVLLAASPGALLPTIRSRCQPVWFGPIPQETVVAELVRRGLSESDARDAARLTDGSLGQAIRFANDGIVPVAKELEQRLTAALTGKGSDDLPKFLKTAGESLAEKVLERDPEGSKDQANRESLALLTHVGEGSLRRMMRNAKTASGLEKLCGGVEKLTAARLNLESNVNVTLALQQLAAELEQ